MNFCFFLVLNMIATLVFYPNYNMLDEDENSPNNHFSKDYSYHNRANFHSSSNLNFLY